MHEKIHLEKVNAQMEPKRQKKNWNRFRRKKDN
jgi:hypothetical protein